MRVWARRLLLAAPILLAATGCPSSPIRSAADAWYSAAPLLVSLRPGAREGLEARLGVRALEDVPLYDLDVSVDLARARFLLKEDVWLTRAEGDPADWVLRIYANAPSPRAADAAPPIRLVAGVCPGGACVVALASRSALRVTPTAPRPAGGRLRVSLTFEGDLERIDGARTSLLAQSLEGMESLAGRGEGAGNYGVLAVGDGIASFGNFYAVLARRGPAGWETAESSALGDLGSDVMAMVRARIEVPAAAKVLSSGVVVADAEPAAAGRRAVRVAAGGVRDFAFVAGEDLEIATANVGDVVVRASFRPSDRKAGARALDVATAALADYERRFGPYPYPALGVAEAAIVGGAGGVEWSGLVTIASMFYKPLDAGAPPSAAGGADLGGLLGSLGLAAAATSGMTDGMLEFVVAHEVAHQYWHGLVGSDSREHPFMDEALAQYSALVYLEDRYGEERALRDGALNVKANYQMMRLMGAADCPADQPVDRFASPVAYAGIVYGKAPYYFAAARRAMGDEAFFAALRGYARSYAFRQAPPRALTDDLAPGDPRVSALATRWLREAHGDDDLGKADLAALVGAAVDPETAKRLGPLLKALGGDKGGSVDVDALMKELLR